MMSVAAPEDIRGLPGWPGADAALALSAYLETVDLLPAGWPRPGPADRGDPAGFFGRAFRPGAVQHGRLTGYFEPEYPASPVRTEAFRWPVHRVPPGVPADRPWLTRARIVATDALAGQEIAWLDDPLSAYLVQVQGSARLRLPDGAVLRLGFAGRNGHPYRSIGAELLRRGALVAPVTLAAIRGWCLAHPNAVPGLLATNPSYVFFRCVDTDPALGPAGSMGRPVTAGHSLAVDPAHVTLGGPVWIGSGGAGMAPRLCVAQDTGSAIRGPGRGDLFCGTGAAAGEMAGAINAIAALWPLLPRGGR